MKSLHRLLLSFATFACTAPAFADSTIVIIRHGEKPDQGLGQLDCRGLNRALALAPLLLSRYGQPAAIYAPNPAKKKKDKGVSYAYVRPLATIEPLAIRAGLPVDVTWGMQEIAPLAKRLLAAQGTQIIAWEHHLGEALARQLLTQSGGNGNDVPTWGSDDFDSIFVIRIGTDAQGKRRAAFSHEHEGLDGQSATCYEPPAAR